MLPFKMYRKLKPYRWETSEIPASWISNLRWQDAVLRFLQAPVLPFYSTYGDL